MLSGSSPSRLPRISNRTAPEPAARKVGLGCVEGSWVGGESPKSFRQRLTKILGQVRSLANFSSSGREEEGGKKKIPSLPRTAVQQTRKNELLAGKQQNFPKSALAGLLLSVPTSPAQRVRGVPPAAEDPWGNARCPGRDGPVPHGSARAGGREKVAPEQPSP